MQGEMEEVVVLIVGAGPAGLATSACLNVLNIPNIVLEKEDCHASLWKKRTYDRLKLHLAKEFCSLPHMPFPPSAPTFVPKNGFVAYLDEYVSHFGINPRCNRLVEYAYYDAEGGSWRVEVKNKSRNAREVYVAQFLVVATGENSEGLIPDVPGLETFGGDYFHSNQYENGKKFSGKNVLVVGTGNSGMEISYDLSNWGAKTSIAVRSPVHVLSKEMVHLAMHLLKFVPVKAVDKLCVLLAKSKYGKLSKYGLPRPKKGPFYLKATTGRSPTIDVGCVKKIKSREIKTFPSIKSIDGNRIEFINGEIDRFDAIVFATGYRSTVGRWLNKNDSRNLFNEDGMPNKSVTNHWKGEKGLYCAGFAQQGLQGISKDAKKISEDINIFVTERKAQDDYEHQVQLVSSLNSAVNSSIVSQ